WLTLALFAYIGAAFMSHPDWWAVLRGTFVPTWSWNRDFLTTLVALLGTTISPYLFFWQANQEVEERKAQGPKGGRQRKGATDGELRYATWDVVIGMFVSNLVMYFIILASAATMHQTGQTIRTARDDAEGLRPLAGEAASGLIALGLIGTVLLAVRILTGSSA